MSGTKKIGIIKNSFFFILLLSVFGAGNIKEESSSWQRVNKEMGDITVYSLMFNGNDFFAGTRDSGIFLSTNNGASWRAVNTGLTNPYSKGYSVINGFSLTGNNLFAATGSGVFVSVDKGNSWKIIDAGFLYPQISLLTASGNNLFAANGGGIFCSKDTGASWNALNDGLPITNLNTPPYLFAGPLFAHGNKIFTAIYRDKTGAIFRLNDNGVSWEKVKIQDPCVIIRTFAANGNMLFAGGDGMFRSEDNGSHWKAINKGLPYRNVRTNVSALIVSGSNLFAGSDDGIFLSTDNGDSWKAVNSGLPKDKDYPQYSSVHVFSLAINGDTLFAGTSSGIFKQSISAINR